VASDGNSISSAASINLGTALGPTGTTPALTNNGNGQFVMQSDPAPARALIRQKRVSRVSWGVVETVAVERAYRDLLIAIGEDPDRDGLRDTPARAARFWREFIEHDAGKVDTTFESVEIDQMVVVSGIRVYSLCEHHLLPFWCNVAVGYIAQSKVVGLSKLGRLAHKAAHRLQLQERLCQQVANDLSEIAQTPDVAVVAQGEHLCMSMRGVRTPALMTSSVMRGRFRDRDATRAEFMQLALAGTAGQQGR
jgi:GTP cyclohydrolase I